LATQHHPVRYSLKGLRPFLHRSVNNLIIPGCQCARCAKLVRVEPKQDSKRVFLSINSRAE
jgi:hypothetical protein